MQYAWFDLLILFGFSLDRRANMVLEIRVYSIALIYFLLMNFFFLFLPISVCAGANERFIFYLLHFVRNVLFV